MAALAVMVIIETDDPRLAIPPDLSTVRATKAFRQAVIENLPKLTRVVAVMPEEEARFMMTVHMAAAEFAGHEDGVIRPPPEYHAPADAKNANDRPIPSDD